MTHLCGICSAAHRIHDTARVAQSDGTVDCLIYIQAADIDYEVFTRQPAFQYVVTYRYCRRSTLFDSEDMLSIANLTFNNGTAFTFDQLRSMNITDRQLYDWYVPIDIIEDYSSGKQSGFFVNCSSADWFGATCEYTFGSDETFVNILMLRTFGKCYDIPDNLSLFTNGTCYEINNTNCESILCLDWREICDGKIDCKNGFDEQNCQELLMNKCDPSTEYRCNDGQCIDKYSGAIDVQATCSKYTKMAAGSFKNCYCMFKEYCENEKCALLEFSCGDGYCYDGPIKNISGTPCRSQRDQRYLEQMPSSTVILFSHVHIIYSNTQPQTICYNQTLCPYLSSRNLAVTTYTSGGLPCHPFKTFSSQTYSTFSEMIMSVKRLVRSCSLLPYSYNYPNSVCPSYRCKDDNRCLSYDQILDGFADCKHGDDEHNTHVCPPNSVGLFACDNETRCIPVTSIYDGVKDCNDETDEAFSQLAFVKCINPFSRKCSYYSQGNYIDVAKLQFHQICNGVLEYLADAENNTDESNCVTEEWPCDAYRSKCDRLWNCPDGRDELGCNTTSLASLYCSNTKHFCISDTSGELECLAMENVNDGITDCVGSSDEREFCRNKYPYDMWRRYRCRNSEKCIPLESICNCKVDCPEEDDETTACAWYNEQDPLFECKICSNIIYENEYTIAWNGSGDLFCDLIDMRSSDFWTAHQGLEVSLTNTQNRVEQKSYSQTDPFVLWICNRGIYVRSPTDPSGFVCFCSDYYYGDRCQYQRKRIKLTVQVQMKSSFLYTVSTFKFVVLLVHTNKTTITIISHVQFVYIPRYKCSPMFYIPLLYPLKEPYRPLTNYSIHIHVFNLHTLEHWYSRNYPLLFEFLPVQILAKKVLLPESKTDPESKQILLAYTGCRSCSNVSRCLGHDVSLARDICVCPSNYIGRRCLFQFDPCTNETCGSHGKCLPLYIDRDLSQQFQCLCDPGWYGQLCENPLGRVNVSLAEDMTYLLSHRAYLHLIESDSYLHIHPHYIYFHHLLKGTFNLTFITNDTEYIPEAGFIQFYEHQNKFDYYFLFLRKLNEKPIHQVSVEVQSSRRCRSVKELFDANILAQPDLRRVKNYQQPCLQRDHLLDQFLCFYDDYLMCTCAENNHTDCFPFQTNLDRCDDKECFGRGLCVQDHHLCPFSSECICEQCAYGTFCQFSTAGYTLSLDGIIGSHILLTVSSLSEQSSVVQITIAFIIIVVIFGIVLNVLSICTFVQKETQDVGCGFYLLVSSIIGLLTVIILVCKTALLFSNDQTDAGCSSIEFLLRWCPTSCEWLNTAVAVERAVAVKQTTKYSRIKSKQVVKWMIPVILIVVGLISMPELFFRRIVFDRIDERNWCVLTLNSDRSGLLAFYSILNIFSFLIPLTLNLTSAAIIILTTTQSKQKTNKNPKVNVNEKVPWTIHFKVVKIQILRHKHILITPVVVTALTLPRLVLAFVLVCTKLDQGSILSMLAYLAGFLPTMAIPFAFVWPSKTYRTPLIIFTKKIFKIKS